MEQNILYSMGKEGASNLVSLLSESLKPVVDMHNSDRVICSCDSRGVYKPAGKARESPIDRLTWDTWSPSYTAGDWSLWRDHTLLTEALFYYLFHIFYIKNSFFDIKKSIFDMKNIFWYQELFLDVKKLNFRNQKLISWYQKIEYLISENLCFFYQKLFWYTKIDFFKSRNTGLTWDSPSYTAGGWPLWRVWTLLPPVYSRSRSISGSPRASTGPAPSAWIALRYSSYTRRTPAWCPSLWLLVRSA